MNSKAFAGRKFIPLVIAATAWLALSGCVYDVPITPKPTAKVDARLLGNWTSQDGKTKMQVAKFDDSNYVLLYDGQLYRAWESDVAGTPFFSVENLDSTKTDDAYKFAYTSWKIAADGTLHGRSVNDKIVPDSTTSSAAVRKLLKDNLKNPDLLGDEVVFVRDH